MCTRSQTRNRNRQQQAQPAVVQPFHLEEPFVNPPLVLMADNRTMAQLLQAPTEGYEDAIVIPEINANFELKYGLINLVQNKQFFRHDKEDPHVVAKVSSNSSTPGISPDVAALTTEVSELKNLMKTMLIDKQKVQAPATVKAVEQSCVTCGGTHSYKNCPATDGNVYQDNIQEYVSQAAAANFNQGNTNSRPPMVANQIRPPGFPPIQNNQNRFNPNQGNNFNQNRGTNFNQNRNFNQGQVYQPPTIQTPVYQAQMQGVSKTYFENYIKANDAVLRNMQNVTFLIFRLELGFNNLVFIILLDSYKVMAASNIPVSAEENLGDPIDIRVDIIHPEPVAAVAFPAAAIVRTQAQHGEAIRGIQEHLLGVPIQEELTALRFRADIAEAENASLHNYDNESSDDDNDDDDVEKDEEDGKEEEHLASVDPLTADITKFAATLPSSSPPPENVESLKDNIRETMTTVNQGMSVEEIERVVAQRVANTIKAIAMNMGIKGTAGVIARSKRTETMKTKLEVLEHMEWCIP
ncbi:hypothetical protein Tco_0285337 [Tanacetum coccineum]